MVLLYVEWCCRLQGLLYERVCVCGGGMTTRRQSGDLFPSVCVGVLAETGPHYMVD